MKYEMIKVCLGHEKDWISKWIMMSTKNINQGTKLSLVFWKKYFGYLWKIYWRGNQLCKQKSFLGYGHVLDELEYEQAR